MRAPGSKDALLREQRAAVVRNPHAARTQISRLPRGVFYICISLQRESNQDSLLTFICYVS